MTGSPRDRLRPAAPDGVLLVHAAQSAVEVWASRGVVPVDVAALADGWTALVPVSARTAVDPPYADSIPVLLGRPVPLRMRPAFGFALRRLDAVVAVQARKVRSRRRWLVWGPGEGLIRPAGLPVAGVRDLIAASGRTDPGGAEAVRAVLADSAGTARDLLADLLTVLGLPGGDLVDGTRLVGQIDGVRRVEPHGRAVAGFEGAVHEERLWHEELGL